MNTTLDFQYRGGWVGTQTWSTQEDRWVRVVNKAGRRVEQGPRTFEKLLDALDRIDGRPVMRDFINGLQAGMTAAEASVPVPYGPDGSPRPAGTEPPHEPTPLVIPDRPTGPRTAYQPSLFEEFL